jgi:hypothetical protein
MGRRSERVAVVISLGLMCGCAPSSGNDIGRAQMSLTALGSSGRLYRLRAGTIDVSGPSMTSFSTETDPTATKVSLELKVGDYQATLEPGWYLEGAVATVPPTFEIVAAVLVSANPLPFPIADRQITPVQLVFASGSDIIKVGDGEAAFSIRVDDCADGGCSDGGGAAGAAGIGGATPGGPAGAAGSGSTSTVPAYWPCTANGPPCEQSSLTPISCAPLALDAPGAGICSAGTYRCGPATVCPAPPSGFQFLCVVQDDLCVIECSPSGACPAGSGLVCRQAADPNQPFMLCLPPT